MKPRIRTIKPEAHTDEGLWDLEQESGLPIFRAFTALWSCADKEGRFEWRPRMLKTHCLPYWDGDFSRVLDALTTRGFLVRYAVAGREYGMVRTFTAHQVVNNRESESVLPSPGDSIDFLVEDQQLSRVPDACPTRAPRPLSPARVEGKGREGKGREGKGREGEGVDASRMMSPQPAAREGSRRSDVVWLNQLCAEVTCWAGSLLDGDRLERTATELVKRGEACAAERGIDTRAMLELVLRKWWTPKRMATKKAWVTMALQDWHETLAEVDDEQERRERMEGMNAH